MFRHRGLKKKGQYKSGGMGYYYNFTTTGYAVSRGLL